MVLEPQYAENIIVSIRFQDEWHWYVTDKEIWFLDSNKLSNAFVEKGYDINDQDNDTERFGIRVVNEQTVDLFLSHIKEYRVEANDLRQKVLEICSNSENYDCLLNMYPALCVDFDMKTLRSLYPEPASYENYVPDGWIGKYEDFTIIIPEKLKYWLICGKDYFKEYSNL